MCVKISNFIGYTFVTYQHMANFNIQMSHVLMATTGAHIVATPRLSIKLSATENVTFAG